MEYHGISWNMQSVARVWHSANIPTQNTEWPDATWHDLLLRSVSSAPSSSLPGPTKRSKRSYMGNHFVLFCEKLPPHRYLCGIGLCNSFALRLRQDWRVILGFASKLTSLLHNLHVHALLFGGFSTGQVLQRWILNLVTCETSEHQQSKNV